MLDELRSEGHVIEFVGAHGVSADYVVHQAEIVAKASYPLLQETPSHELRQDYEAETRHAILLFDAKGKLKLRLSSVTDAMTDEGYAALKQTIVETLLP